jgi:selenocysteine-specific elongation factor
VYVVATAGHVDHGKSTLVRALTGMEPDRWAEERRRGMTIDLGYAWTALASGAQVAFVDVPGHQRFIGNMLAGVGPAPAVLFVVAADEGWSRQSAEHLAAVHALRLTHGVLAVTRSDLADPEPALADARARIARSSLGDVAAVVVSGRTGLGLADLRQALDTLLAGLPAADPTARVRLWVDRSFTVRGSGTVVTGTLGAGCIRVGDELELRGRRVAVRGLQSLGRPLDEVAAVARVALNLRGVDPDSVGRGDALLAADRWNRTTVFDARLDAGPDRLPGDLVLHVGTAATAARLRPLGPDLVRITVADALPLQVGDRAILRDPGRQTVAAGLLLLDPDPPALRRRGAAAARAAALRDADGRPDAAAEIARRQVVSRAQLRRLGVPVDPVPAGVHERAGWLVAADTWQRWRVALAGELDRWAADHPLDPGMPDEALRRALDVPARELLDDLLAGAGVRRTDGRVLAAARTSGLGPSEAAVAELEQRLAGNPFAAPERAELAELGLGRRELAAAEKVGRLLRLADDIVLLPSAPAAAVAVLQTLDQPFTASAAKQAWGTTRRVALPLLEHLDALGWTERGADQRRRVVT